MTAREMLNKVKDICSHHEDCDGCPLYFKRCLLHYVPATEWSDRVMKTILSIVVEDEESCETKNGCEHCSLEDEDCCRKEYEMKMEEQE